MARRVAWGIEMRVHFWLILALTAGLAAFCGWLLLEFPNRQTGTSVFLQYDQMQTWVRLTCGTGVYAALIACVLTHAARGRWRFWATVAASVIYLYVCGGLLVLLIVQETPMITTDRVADMAFVMFIEINAAVLYAVALLLLHVTPGLRRTPYQSMLQGSGSVPVP